MIYIGYFILFFAILRLGVALSNVLSRVHLPSMFNLQNKPMVSILIPARNEAAQIGNLLSDIQTLTYSNVEVWVYDDLSSDDTAKIVKRFASADSRINLIEGTELPDGWLGKNHACDQLARCSKGSYLLFLDADVRISGNLLEKSVYLMQKHKSGLLSIFPKQILDHFGTWISVPLMNWILLSLLPLLLVRACSWISFSAANGQFMLFDAGIYRKLQPHDKLKNQRVEDIEICKYYKRNRVRIATILGDNLIQCRMYTSLHEAIDGFSKNIFAFFGNSVFITILFVIITTLSAPCIFLLFGIKTGILYLLIIIGIRICTSFASRQNIVLNLIYIPLQQCVFIITTIYAWHKSINNSLSWKGRNI